MGIIPGGGAYDSETGPSSEYEYSEDLLSCAGFEELADAYFEDPMDSAAWPTEGSQVNMNKTEIRNRRAKHCLFPSIIWPVFTLNAINLLFVFCSSTVQLLSALLLSDAATYGFRLRIAA